MGFWNSAKEEAQLMLQFLVARRVLSWIPDDFSGKLLDARTVMTRMGWFTPPFDTGEDLLEDIQQALATS